MDPTLTIAGILVAIVFGVGAFALAPKPPWLERVWLWMIGAAFVLYIPIWIGTKIEDHGWKAVVIGLGGLFVAGIIRGLPSPPSGGSRRS